MSARRRTCHTCSWWSRLDRWPWPVKITFWSRVVACASREIRRAACPSLRLFQAFKRSSNSGDRHRARLYTSALEDIAARDPCRMWRIGGRWPEQARTTSPRNLVTSLTKLAKDAETSIEVVARELISREKSRIWTIFPAYIFLLRRGINFYQWISFSSLSEVSRHDFHEE